MADNTSPPCFVGGLAVVPPMGLDPALDVYLRKVTGQVAARMSSGRYAVAAVCEASPGSLDLICLAWQQAVDTA
jgi:hypothetical protein